MNYRYLPSFVRDVKKSTIEIQVGLQDVIENIKTAKTISEIHNVKKLKGHKNAYRVKIKTYRLCFTFSDDKELILVRFLPRKDVYKVFP